MHSCKEDGMMRIGCVGDGVGWQLELEMGGMG